MNSYLKQLFLVVIVLYSTSCVSAVESANNALDPDKLCQQAKSGNLKAVTYDDPKVNSFLFNCVVVMSISGINKSSDNSAIKSQRKIEKQNLIKAADILLSKKIDAQFKNKFGDTLLMTVIFSYLDKTWKEQTVEKLIKLGVNINEKNNEGYTAMDFAKSNGNKTIIKLLTDAIKVH